MMKKKHALFLAVGLIISIAATYSETESLLKKQFHTKPDSSFVEDTNRSATIKQNYSLAFFLNPSNPYYLDNLQIFKKNLKVGDYLLVYGTPKDAPDVVKKAQDVKDQGTGIKVYSAIGYRKIHDMVTSVSSLPKGIDFIIYDYEGGPGYSPEFSTDEAASILNFAKAKWLVEEYNNATGGNARLLVTPPYGQLRQAGWDWQSASANMGAIDIQLQAFLKDPQLVVNAKDIVEQIRRQGNDKIVFVQLSIIPTRGTILDNIQAINNLKGIRGIDAVLIFYKNTQGADLEKLFAMLRR